MKRYAIMFVLLASIVGVMSVAAQATGTLPSNDRSWPLPNPTNENELELITTCFGGCTPFTRSYVQFDFGTNPTLGNQTIGNFEMDLLTTFASDAGGTGVTFTIYETGDGWTEADPNPPALGAALGTVGPQAFAGPGETVTISTAQLTAYMEAQRTGDGVASFAIEISAADAASFSPSLRFGSKDAAAGQPALRFFNPTAVDMVDTNASNNNMALWAGIVVLFGLLTAGFVVVRKQGQAG